MDNRSLYVIRNEEGFYYHFEPIEEGYIIKHSRIIGYATHFDTLNDAYEKIDSVERSLLNFGEEFNPFKVVKVEAIYTSISENDILEGCWWIS